MSSDKDIGRESIRINGKKLDELPWVAAAHVQQEMPKFEDGERKTKIAQLKAIFPKLRIPYIEGRIKECNDSIQKINIARIEAERRIIAYEGQISLCEHRDKMLKGLDPEKDSNKISELKRQFPPFDVHAMRVQIQQDRGAIERAEIVVAREMESIAELREARALCQKRDAELKRLGASID